MNNINKTNEERIECDVCMKEIPVSEAKSAEATEYVAHFCGLDCYEKWLNKAEQEKTKDS